MGSRQDSGRVNSPPNPRIKTSSKKVDLIQKGVKLIMSSIEQGGKGREGEE